MQRVGELQFEEAVLVLARKTALSLMPATIGWAQGWFASSRMIISAKSASSWLRISQQLSMAGVIAGAYHGGLGGGVDRRGPQQYSRVSRV
jgi:hypothetical protein